MTRLIIRARVVDLESIPHFSVFSDSPSYDGQSWTVQIEILQHGNLGVRPPDEEVVPPLPDNQGPPLFDFFRLGQQVFAPVGAHVDYLALQANQNNQGGQMEEEENQNV